MNEEITEETTVEVVEHPEGQATEAQEAQEKPEAQEVPPRRKRRKYQVVKALRIAHGNVLLEWEKDGLVERCYLPLSIMEHAKVGKFVSVEEDELAKGAPFGDDLTPYLAVQAPTPAQVQDLLRRRGVWRRGEVLQSSSVVRSALQALYQLDVVKMQGRIKESLAREQRGGA